jgi:hypothetical protein
VTDRELFHRWQTLVGAEGRAWMEPANLGGFFQYFRPTGVGVERALEGLPLADRVLPRLLNIYAATSAGWEQHRTIFDYFRVHHPPIISRQQAEELVWKYFQSLREISIEVADDELLARLDHYQTTQFVAKPAPEGSDADLDVWTRDVETDYLLGLEREQSQILLMKEGIWTMANDLELMYYVLWPLYERSSDLIEPFAPYFELWRRGVAVRFGDDLVIRGYAPAGNITDARL